MVTDTSELATGSFIYKMKIVSMIAAVLRFIKMNIFKDFVYINRKFAEGWLSDICKKIVGYLLSVYNLYPKKYIAV